MEGRFILIGGTGFFGSALAGALRARGATVLTASRRESSGGGQHIRVCLPGDIRGVEDALRPGDRIVYLVAATPLRRPLGGRRTYRRLHLEGFRTVLALAETRGVQQLTYTSALGVHTAAGSAYAETKARAETLLADSRVRGTVVAPSILFGRGSELVSALDLVSRLPVVPIPSLSAPFRPIHVADAARITASALTSTQPPPRVELSGPELLTVTEIARSYLEPRGTTVIELPRALSRRAVSLVSRIKLPGAPAELEGMLAIDNAGAPPEDPTALIRFTEWATRYHSDR